MKTSIIKHDDASASGKQYEVRLTDGANQRYVQFTRAELLELRQKIDGVLSDEGTSLSLAIEIVVRDQRESSADITPADAAHHARDTLTVDDLIDHGNGDDTYAAYKRVLEATDDELLDALLLIH